MRLVLCDDNRMLCEALAAAMEAWGHQVVAITSTVADGLAAVDAHRPDVVLLDLLPAGTRRASVGSEPFTGIKAMRERYPDTTMLMFSSFVDRATWTVAKQIGVAGFLGKDQDVGQIAAALDVIAAGGSVLNPGQVGVRAGGRVRPQPKNPLDELSPREKEIVARIVEGQSTRQMAFAMNITVGTVRTYVKNVLTKLGAHSRLQLAALACRDGLLIDQAPASAVLVQSGAPNAWSPGRPVLQSGLGRQC